MFAFICILKTMTFLPFRLWLELKWIVNISVEWEVQTHSDVLWMNLKNDFIINNA